MKYKYEFTLSIGFAAAKQSEIVEYDEKPTKSELDEDWENWINNFIDGGWIKI